MFLFSEGGNLIDLGTSSLSLWFGSFKISFTHAAYLRIMVQARLRSAHIYFSLVTKTSIGSGKWNLMVK